MTVRELELDLDAFEGPFDLLLTLVLREELPLAEVDVAGIVLAFVERLAEREELDLDACGEFLVLVAALLELKARALFAVEGEYEDLEPPEAAEELARRLEEYRRIKGAAEWLGDRLAAERDRFFRLGPAPLAPKGERRLAEQDPQAARGFCCTLSAAEPPAVLSGPSQLLLPPVRGSWSSFRRCSVAAARFDFDQEVVGLSRVEQAVAFLALLHCAAPARSRWSRRRRSRPSVCPVAACAGGGGSVERPLRLIEANPHGLARAHARGAARRRVAAPVAWRSWREARRRRPGAGRDRARVPGRALSRRAAAASCWSTSAGGWAFRASREAAEACGRLFERPVERNLSQASLETLAVVAYLGPCSRPEIARWRGVAVDSVVAGLVERGLIAEAGRGDLGAVRYRVTPLFERVFGLESLAALPRLEDFGGDAEELRGRLESLAERRPA